MSLPCFMLVNRGWHDQLLNVQCSLWPGWQMSRILSSDWWKVSNMRKTLSCDWSVVMFVLNDECCNTNPLASACKCHNTWDWAVIGQCSVMWSRYWSLIGSEYWPQLSDHLMTPTSCVQVFKQGLIVNIWIFTSHILVFTGIQRVQREWFNWTLSSTMNDSNLSLSLQWSWY